jgi:hypothetical protein
LNDESIIQIQILVQYRDLGKFLNEYMFQKQIKKFSNMQSFCEMVVFTTKNKIQVKLCNRSRQCLQPVNSGREVILVIVLMLHSLWLRNQKNQKDLMMPTIIQRVM